MPTRPVTKEVFPPDANVLKLAKTTAPRQIQAYLAYFRIGTVVGAAREMGLDCGTCSKYIRIMQDKAMANGWVAPDSKIIDVDPKVLARNENRVKKKLGNQVSTFVVTWAQNATPVHEGFLASLQHYCKHKSATLLVIAGRYKNPTSQFSISQKNEEYWADEIADYLIKQRIHLNDSLVIMGDLKSQPTAENPLQGHKGITQDKSGVFGHPKIALESVATPQHKLPKLLFTTGAVTHRNYTDTNLGKKGEFHHSFGATVLEIQGDKFFGRQLAACEDGSFIDLDTEYTPEGARPADRPLGYIPGDMHKDFIDPDCERALFGKQGIIRTLRPKQVVYHDLLDSYSISHHHLRKPFTQYAKEINDRHLAEGEIRRCLDGLREWQIDGVEQIIIASNHNDHLLRWLEDGESRVSTKNLPLYHDLKAKVYRGTRLGMSGAEVPNPLEILTKEWAPDLNVRFTGRNESLMIADVECGMHGDIGPNGSKGSVNALADIGVKVVSGHGHSPGIKHGHYRTGTNSRLDLEYAIGPSSWMHSDCIIYANGKRSLIHKLDGQWKAQRLRKPRAKNANANPDI